MKTFFEDRQSAHDPKHFVSNEQMADNCEQPKRIEVLSKGAVNASCTLWAPSDFGMGPIGEIHLPFNLKFLQTVFISWQKSVNRVGEVEPSCHAKLRRDTYPKSAIRQAGFDQANTSYPIGEHTSSFAYWSAQAAPIHKSHMSSFKKFFFDAKF